MAAQSIDTFVLAFSDPALNVPEPQRARVNTSISFELYNDDQIRTLSTNQADGDIEGLLYVPNLDPQDPCVNASAQYVPNNVTRFNDIPTSHYLYIALAPWLSASCTKSYLAAAQGVTAFIFYLPDGGSGLPPLPNDKAWELNDGGQWKLQNKFPVYAIPGTEGSMIMEQLAVYSGNSSDLFIRQILAVEQFDATDYVRLYTSLGTNGSSNLPTLWAFLLIVLGIVLLLVGTTSTLMRFCQRRHRRALQRRVDRGEVDLETLGIKRTRIQQEAIDTLPTCIYIPSEDPTGTIMSDKKRDATVVKKQPKSDIPQSSDPPIADISTPNPTMYDQSACIICSEDFIPSQTVIRSLPCHHIYHPTCIDPWLASNSSLCPVCKTPAIPPSPSNRVTEPVTNAMVRHERRLRRRQRDRENRTNPVIGNEGDPRQLLAHMRRGVQSGRRLFSAPSATPGRNTQPTRSQIEMSALAPSSTARAVSNPLRPSSSPSSGPPSDANLRREWMRRRFSTLRGQAPTAEDADLDMQARTPRWRRAVGAVFPGFR